MAEANLPAAKARAERLRGLAEIHAVGDQDVEDAEAASLRAQASVAASRAALESARINLAWTPIKAPISGRTGRSSVTVGALVAAYQPVPLVTIQQLDPIYVDVQQSSAELLRLRRALSSGRLTQGGESANRVRLLLEDGTPYAHEGTLEFRDITVESTTGSVTLRMVFPNPDHELLPGMFVRAIVEEGVNEHAILAPQEGVSRDSRGNAVALVLGADNKRSGSGASARTRSGQQVVGRGGPLEGDRLIVDGLQQARSGVQARAVPADTTQKAKRGPPCPDSSSIVLVRLGHRHRDDAGGSARHLQAAGRSVRRSRRPRSRYPRLSSRSLGGDRRNSVIQIIEQQMTGLDHLAHAGDQRCLGVRSVDLDLRSGHESGSRLGQGSEQAGGGHSQPARSRAADRSRA